MQSSSRCEHQVRETQSRRRSCQVCHLESRCTPKCNRENITNHNHKPPPPIPRRSDRIGHCGLSRSAPPFRPNRTLWVIPQCRYNAHWGTSPLHSSRHRATSFMVELLRDIPVCIKRKEWELGLRRRPQQATPPLGVRPLGLSNNLRIVILRLLCHQCGLVTQENLNHFVVVHFLDHRHRCTCASSASLAGPSLSTEKERVPKLTYLQIRALLSNRSRVTSR